MLTIRGLSTVTLARLLATKRWRVPDRPMRVFLCVADHFEPKWQKPPARVATERVARWLDDYPRLAERFQDSLGRPPQHTFFYPAEEYEPEYLDSLAMLCRRGLGDVEVHLHHDKDTPDGLRETLTRFTSSLHERHGLLEKNHSGQVTFAFVHGNWALDNSRPDGRWCGVNDEISVLLETGCYADFTMPSAPAPCQTSTINSIYYAIDDPLRPKSHDRGIPARVGARPPPHSLLMIQGPLTLDWRRRKYGLLPKIENGDLTHRREPMIERLWNWLAARVHVQGKDDWLFVKLHTHGAQEANAQMLLGEPMRAFHAALASLARSNDWFHYYYVTARQMVMLVHALEADGELESPDSILRRSASGRCWPVTNDSPRASAGGPVAASPFLLFQAAGP